MTKITDKEYEDYMIKTLMVQDMSLLIENKLFAPENKIKDLIKGLNQNPNELTVDYLNRLDKLRNSLYKSFIQYQKRIEKGKAKFSCQNYSTKFFNYYDQDGQMKRSMTIAFKSFDSNYFINLIDDIIKYKKVLLTI